MTPNIKYKRINILIGKGTQERSLFLKEILQTEGSLLFPGFPNPTMLLTEMEDSERVYQSLVCSINATKPKVLVWQCPENFQDLDSLARLLHYILCTKCKNIQIFVISYSLEVLKRISELPIPEEDLLIVNFFKGRWFGKASLLAWLEAELDPRR